MTTTSLNAASSSNSQPIYGPQLDLCTIGKLCRYFRQVKSPNTGDPCIGFLERTQTFKHFVYPSPSLQRSLTTSPSTSLKQILSSGTEEDWVQKLRLARLLSLAVLRFHSTPWLSESWSSNDVFSFDKDDALFESPCVNAHLSSTQSNAPINHPGSNASSLATNEFLFNLGVVLIELGYDAPIESLNQAGHLQSGASGQVAEFMAARRLGASVHKKLNMTYGRLVEKCLNCNFGVATNLDDTELQSAVIVHVVNQLDICLEQYTAFNQLAPSLTRT